MSGTVDSLSSFGLIGSVGRYALALNERETTLTAQSASGLVAPGITGLGEQTAHVLDLQPQAARLAAFSANATLAASRLQTVQTALTSIASIAQSNDANLVSLQTQQGSGLSSAMTSYAAGARDDLGSLTTLLNTSSGDSYVFGAAGQTTPPVPNPVSVTAGPLSQAVAAAVSGLATNGAAATLSSIVSAISANSPFTPALAGNPPPVSVDVGPGEQAVVGFPATSGSGLSGPSATSTGSSIEDLIAVLSAVSNLSPSDAQDSQFPAFVSGLRSLLGNAQTGLSSIVSTLGVSQQQVSDATATNAALSSALTTQIGNLTSVDLPTVATQLTQTQNQLLASYEIINDLRSLTLAAYI